MLYGFCLPTVSYPLILFGHTVHDILNIVTLSRHCSMTSEVGGTVFSLNRREFRFSKILFVQEKNEMHSLSQCNL